METLVVIQLATVVEVESGLTSTTITTVTDATKVIGNIDRRLSATEKCHMIVNIAIEPTCNKTKILSFLKNLPYPSSVFSFL